MLLLMVFNYMVIYKKQKAAKDVAPAAFCTPTLTLTKNFS